MSYTKRQFITAAMEEIGLASYVFDLEPEQIESAARRLDAMMAEWNGKGIRLGYPLPGSPENTGIDDETEVPDMANEAVIVNLAVRLAPSFGKSSGELRGIAKQAYNTVISKVAMPPEMQLPSTMPRGQGNKPWRYDNPYLDEPTDNILVGPDGELELE